MVAPVAILLILVNAPLTLATRTQRASAPAPAAVLPASPAAVVPAAPAAEVEQFEPGGKDGKPETFNPETKPIGIKDSKTKAVIERLGALAGRVNDEMEFASKSTDKLKNSVEHFFSDEQKKHAEQGPKLEAALRGFVDAQLSHNMELEDALP